METIAKKANFRGCHRICSAESTIARIRPHLRQFGITRVANITGLDRIGIPTVVVCRPNACSLSVSQGKGLDLDAAKASGLMEAIELFHAEHTRITLRLSSLTDLACVQPVVDVKALPQYLRPFDPDEPLLWCKATRASSDEHRWVPFDMVHANLTLPSTAFTGFFPVGSNGLASGNTRDEAIVHGACELIERDALALFFRLPPAVQAARQLDLTSVDEPDCLALLERYRAAEMRIAIWDITSDLGIAAFHCTIVENDVNPFHRVGKATGHGCHVDRSVALCRALTEAAQSRLTRIAGSRDDIQAVDFERLRSERAIRQEHAVLDSHGTPALRFAAIPSQRFETTSEDLEHILSALQRTAVGPLWVVDLSRAEYPLSVVRVVIPGLEGVPEVPGYVPGQRALGVHPVAHA